MLRPGHVRLPTRQAKPETLGGLTPPRPPQIIKGTNNPIIKPSSPAATNRARVAAGALEAVVDEAIAEVDDPREAGIARQPTGRPVEERLRRPECGIYTR